MNRKGWYLVAYDIASPRRLAKIHRILKNKGIAVQKSVFIVHGTEKDINRLFDHLEKQMAYREDDLRAYPIRHPRDFWTNGPNPMAGLPVYHIDE